MPIPQALLDALNTLQGKKDATDSASAAKSQSAADLIAAQQKDAQAATVLQAAAADLDTQRKIVEAIEDSYYTVGGTSPDAPPPAAS